jgi:anti-sigma-K factor RskA
MSDPHLLLPGYALDALEPEDRRLFEDHLADCEDCRRELAEFAPAITDLSALTATPAPPQLRENVLSAITQVRQQEPAPSVDPQHSAVDDARRPAGAQVVRFAARDRRARAGRIVRTVAAVIGAAAVVAAIALGGWSYGRSQLSRTDRADRAAVSRIIAAPDAHTYRQQTPTGMRVTYLVSEQRNSALVVIENGAAPGNGRTYQLWTVRSRDGKPEFVPDRTFDNPDGPIILSGDIRSAAALGITVEPSGGSRQPTTDPFAVQSL